MFSKISLSYLIILLTPFVFLITKPCFYPQHFLIRFLVSFLISLLHMHLCGANQIISVQYFCSGGKLCQQRSLYSKATVQLYQLQSTEGEGQVGRFSVCFHLFKMREVSEVGVLTTTRQGKVRRLVRNRGMYRVTWQMNGKVPKGP